MDSDRVEGKAKETEGEIQQKWGEAKDKARDAWELACREQVRNVGSIASQGDDLGSLRASVGTPCPLR